MTAIQLSKLRKEFAAHINRVALDRERLVLLRHGIPVAAMVTVEDLAWMEAVEDAEDIEAAKQAMKEEGFISWEEVRRALGL